MPSSPCDGGLVLGSRVGKWGELGGMLGWGQGEKFGEGENSYLEDREVDRIQEGLDYGVCGVGQ
jgi:hypothetical protein